MAEFTLPRNSKITKGREWKPEEGKRPKSFKIYRYDPDAGANPRFDYELSSDSLEPNISCISKIPLYEHGEVREINYHDLHRLEPWY